MIDWMTVVIRIPHRPINGGYLIACDRNGESEFKSDRKLPVRGSYDSAVMVRSSGAVTLDGWFTELWIDGNLSKWLNGHNITGTDNGPKLVADFLMAAEKDLQIEWHPTYMKEPKFNKDKIERRVDAYAGRRMDYPELLHVMPLWYHTVIRGDFLCKRLDITYSFRLSNNQEVNEYIEFLAATSRTKFSKAVIAGDSTVYWNKRSTHWSMKAYNKHRELTKARGKGHKLPKDWPTPVKDRIHDIVEPYIRFELVLRSRTIKKICDDYGYPDATWSALFHHERSDYTSHDKFSPGGLHQIFMDKLQINDLSRYTMDTAIDSLAPTAYAAFSAWKKGVDVRSKYTKSTFYRHRSEILEALGVDIALSAHEVDPHAGTTVRVFRMVQVEDRALQEALEPLLRQVA